MNKKTILELLKIGEEIVILDIQTPHNPDLAAQLGFLIDEEGVVIGEMEEKPKDG